MDNHPIPQNVTGFQFKLIGDMTVKQFAYLATGAILGWLFLVAPAPSLVRLPSAVFFFAFGFALAFIPLEGRPMDVMLASFARALFSPNQYMYQKVGGQLIVPLPTVATKVPTGVVTRPPSDLASYLRALPRQPKSTLDEKEEAFLNALFAPAKAVQAKIIPAHQAVSEQEHREETLAQAEMEIREKLQQAKTLEAKQTATEGTTPAHTTVVELQNELSVIVAEKQRLEEELARLKEEFQRHKEENLFRPSVAMPPKLTRLVRLVPKGSSPQAFGTPLAPDEPNLLSGVIKDPRGNMLPNILIEVKDKEGSPVRAFKTNALGQFTSATPLQNGTYAVTFEDPHGQHTFDAVELLVTGQVLQPLEIFSTDARERLRKQLFTT